MSRVRNRNISYPELFIDEVAVEVVDDVGILVFPHNKDFVDYKFLLGLLWEVHLFDRDFTACGHFYRNVNRTRGTAGEETGTLSSFHSSIDIEIEILWEGSDVVKYVLNPNLQMYH